MDALFEAQRRTMEALEFIAPAEVVLTDKRSSEGAIEVVQAYDYGPPRAFWLHPDGTLSVGQHQVRRAEELWQEFRA